MGEDRAGPPDRLHRRHRAGPVRRGLRPPAPTCSSTRRRSARTSAPARARPATRPPRQAAEHAARRRRQAARADAPLHALLPARDPRRGARRSSRTRSCRATSTRSRSRSRSAASRTWSRANWSRRPRRRLALALVLTAAGAHAGWNFLAKQASGGLALTWLYGSPRSRCGPRWRSSTGVEAASARRRAFMAGSGCCTSATSPSLQHAYEKGDLSVVYPLAAARGRGARSSASVRAARRRRARWREPPRDRSASVALRRRVAYVRAVRAHARADLARRPGASRSVVARRDPARARRARRGPARPADPRCERDRPRHRRSRCHLS